MTQELKVKSVANWFGRDGAVVDRVAELLRGCRWVGVPFAGGMGVLAELVKDKAFNAGVASDLHGHVINLASVLADEGLARQMFARLDAMPLNDHALADAAALCGAIENEGCDGLTEAPSVDGLFGRDPQTHTRTSEVHRVFATTDVHAVDWAAAYFMVSWMSRAGQSGTGSEFEPGRISVRWSAGGGSSSSRWRSAVESIPAWHEVLKRWSFVCLDVFDFLGKVPDVKGNGIYCDPPFPEAGEVYRHGMTPGDHHKLASKLAGYKAARVVVRFHDHPLVRELYPEGPWVWERLSGRAQTNEKRDEVLLTRKAGG